MIATSGLYPTVNYSVYLTSAAGALAVDGLVAPVAGPRLAERLAAERVCLRNALLLQQTNKQPLLET